MKSLFKLFAVFAAVILALLAVIKFVQGCSWKEAVGIAEEFCKEIKESYKTCCREVSKKEKKPEKA